VTQGALRAAAAALAAAGLALAGYLTWVHYDEGALICTRGGGCETVQRSDYAELGGVPVAILGLVAYAAVLALLAWDTPPAGVAAAAIGLGALAFSCYLIVLQLFVIDAICVWCMVNDAAIVPLLAATLVLRLALEAPSPPLPSTGRPRSGEAEASSSAPAGAPSARSGRGSPSGSPPSP
jgi:uncharacterized membrane protein